MAAAPDSVLHGGAADIWGQMHAPACRRMHQQTEALFLTEQSLVSENCNADGGFLAHSSGRYRNMYVVVKFVGSIIGF
jgi:hypothetical protein